MKNKSIVLKYLQIADTFFRDIHDIIAKSKFGEFNEPLLTELFYSYKGIIGVLRHLCNADSSLFSVESFHRLDTHSCNLLDVWYRVVQYRNDSRSVSIDNLFRDVLTS